MIVLDASAAIELLLGTALSDRLSARLLNSNERLHAPHLFDVEILQVLRRLVQLRKIRANRAQLAIDDAAGMAIERHAHVNLLPRVWALRDALSAYDATYVALAEAMDSPLITCDGKLARAHGHSAKVELID